MLGAFRIAVQSPQGLVVPSPRTRAAPIKRHLPRHGPWIETLQRQHAFEKKPRQCGCLYLICPAGDRLIVHPA